MTHNDLIDMNGSLDLLRKEVECMYKSITKPEFTLFKYEAEKRMKILKQQIEDMQFTLSQG